MWRAEDENRDELTYEVQYRREGDTSWKSLKKGLTDSILVWDTTSVPNGRYVVRVVASDCAVQLAGHGTVGRHGEQPPSTSTTCRRRSRSRRCGGRARGRSSRSRCATIMSAVQRVDYSLDGDRWIPVYPKDGIADSRAEQFELTITEDTGSRGVVLRAADALNNVSSARGDVQPAAALRPSLTAFGDTRAALGRLGQPRRLRAAGLRHCEPDARA